MTEYSFEKRTNLMESLNYIAEKSPEDYQSIMEDMEEINSKMADCINKKAKELGKPEEDKGKKIKAKFKFGQKEKED